MISVVVSKAGMCISKMVQRICVPIKFVAIDETFARHLTQKYEENNGRIK